ncbi:hypothetical protein KC19_7G090700 [Ceratodon purpureus]|uniref:Uncharacterized protein n=1 Tax=Ceratodon purpureus TaxID=3225 RepID=A0A8T0H838_CERPU|nr:hypothetical protein KC19_7G090200 [Ceratodon purpureus]KAG0566827.1 hypothetical protein KC19_7G090700 [Ceratodon purpureus]
MSTSSILLASASTSETDLDLVPFQHDIPSPQTPMLVHCTTPCTLWSCQHHPLHNTQLHEHYICLMVEHL